MAASDDIKHPYRKGGSSPRVLLRRLREVMAEEAGAQQRLDRLSEAIAANMVADVCSIYLRRDDDVLELFLRAFSPWGGELEVE